MSKTVKKPAEQSIVKGMVLKCPRCEERFHHDISLVLHAATFSADPLHLPLMQGVECPECRRRFAIEIDIVVAVEGTPGFLGTVSGDIVGRSIYRQKGKSRRLG